ncbi:hypothetical protein SCP_0605210 [Sparassis crispa]|uniref:NEDD8-activating enzyme E1 regulatory subunit n=1 Tax=Sparassis crispa TaxID=139825 RepID=A0A401GQQ4_9APHY|nr:hypothetical protein SCP_0605210 [Sparassis crispa]GBE84542.1 hypothetical protein SCP_0605210 [Sparassis crispa]
MSTKESQTIEQATSTVGHTALPVEGQPNSKTRRYDRQLRLWAASGQSALESSRILVISASATSTAILKNLVLPGVGHFALLDPAVVSRADAGNNFFLNGPASIGRSRAEEAVTLLRELNDSVSAEAITKDINMLLATDDGRDWVRNFSLVITHNLPNDTLDTLSRLLWDDPTGPQLIAVRSAGFLAEFYIQFREHCVSQPHTDETAPSLRITRPFPALLQWARDLDLSALDPTTHAHIPFVVILVHAVDAWRAEHGGVLPSTYAEKEHFKETLHARKMKLDEENFDEAEAQAYRVWGEPAVPPAVASLLASVSTTSAATSPLNVGFHALLGTLDAFVKDPRGPGCLPLSSALPDMKTDTTSYVRLQSLYRDWARIEKARFTEILKEKFPEIAPDVDSEELDTFVKNAHHIRVLRGRRWGTWDEERKFTSSLESSPRETATHLSLAALSTLLSQDPDPLSVTAEGLTKEVQALVGAGVDLPKEVEDAVGELARAPTADLPNTAAFVGGLVAQEAIKLITRQYVPTNGYCVVDLVDSWTGVVGAP